MYFYRTIPNKIIIVINASYGQVYLSYSSVSLRKSQLSL